MVLLRARRAWDWSVVSLTFAAFGYLTIQVVIQRHLGVVLDMLVVAAAFVLLLRGNPEALRNGCPSCGGRPDAVRATDGRRLWTCRACGLERVRRRSRREIEATISVPPKAAT